MAGYRAGANAMTGKLSILFVIATLLTQVACSQDFDFRSEERPEFNARVTPAELVSLQQQGATILDVRLIEDFESDPVLVPDAMYRDPDDIEGWAGQMSPADGPVVVYCVAGRWVSQKAANYLQAEGFEVYSLDGGIEGWKAAGMETRAE
jgi:rhodanese-related sulfurtransferase